MLCFDPFIALFFCLLYLWVCQWLTSTYYTMGLPGLPNKWGILFETPHITFLCRFYGSYINTSIFKLRDNSINWDDHETFIWPGDLDLGPMTLTSLNFLPLYLRAKIWVCMSICLAGRLWQTDTHTDLETDDVKTITSDTSETQGVIIPIASPQTGNV